MTNVFVDNRLLNAEQKKAAEHGNGPLMIIAGAGTGKTTVITERIKYLIANGFAKPQEILALTFTEKAAREMEERVDTAMPYGVTHMWISTFHSFCDRILRNEAIHIGLNPSYVLMSEAEAMLFFRKHIHSFGLSYFRPLGNPNKFIGGMIQHFSRLKDEEIGPDEYLRWVKKKKKKDKKLSDVELEELQKYEELATAYRQYEDLKMQEGVADYSDLISHTLAVFKKRPHILRHYQEQFTYILVDEFQDTNVAQNTLAVLLSGKKKNITVVGDDDQAVYRWRGAAVSNMIQFRATFPNTTVVVLTKNYRSSKEILDRSYDLIQKNNPDRLEVAEQVDKKLESMRRIRGEAIGVLYAENAEYEAELVAKEIFGKITSSSEATKTYTWSDVAILVRANAHAEPFARALSREGIPYQFLGPGQLYRKAEVKDLIAYLKVLYNFEDTIAMYRVLVMDWMKLPPRDIAAISNAAKKYGISLFEICELISGNHAPPSSVIKPQIQQESIQKISDLVHMIHEHLGMIRKESAGQILYFFLEKSGLLQSLARYTNTKDETVAQNISKFFGKLKQYELQHEDASIFAVVDWIDMSMQLGESPMAHESDWSLDNAVRIMTIHSSKGLEFPIVFMVNMSSGRFPSIERREQLPIPDELVKEQLPKGDAHEQEERRLCYVGMTRARDFLYMSTAKYYGDGKREKKVSPFVYEAIGDRTTLPQILYSQHTSSQLSFLDFKKHESDTEAQSIQQRISYISYSQLSSFQNCPLQYKYRYVIKIPAPVSAALSFGDVMHKTLYAFYTEVKNKKSPTKAELMSLYASLWVSVGYGNKHYEEKMKHHGVELLSKFYDKAYTPGQIPNALEEPFKIKITPTVTLGGKIDRIDTQDDGTVEIIDYKTGSAHKSKDVEKDPQLTIYALSVSQEGVFKRSPEKVLVSFYFLEDTKKVSAVRTLAQMEAAKIEVANTVDSIERSTFQPTPGRHCDFCEYRLICEAWK